MSLREDDMTRGLKRQMEESHRTSNHPISVIGRAVRAFGDARAIASGKGHRVVTDRLAEHAPKIIKSVGTNLRRRVSRSR